MLTLAVHGDFIFAYKHTHTGGSGLKHSRGYLSQYVYIHMRTNTHMQVYIHMHTNTHIQEEVDSDTAVATSEQIVTLLEDFRYTTEELEERISRMRLR